jgi:hypothetical protein
MAVSLAVSAGRAVSTNSENWHQIVHEIFSAPSTTPCSRPLRDVTLRPVPKR